MKTDAVPYTLPWYCSTVTLAATAIVIGLQWDISWHETIGRDTFWTLAHIVIYIGGIIGGLTGGILVLRASFGGPSPLRDASVKVWGFRGPLGAWVCVWGAVAMLTSAPFDDWWHNAYGLDVQIISPPHMVLAAGFFSTIFGAMFLLAACQNRTKSEVALNIMYAYTGGVLILMLVILTMEYMFPNKQHSQEFFNVSAIVFPFALTMIGKSSGLPWPATTASLIFTIHRLLIIWVLPLFPGEPQLAPIYREITHFVAPPFPPLLIVPSVAIDYILKKVNLKNDWLAAGLCGVFFAGIYFLVHWPFAEFLLSENGRNWFFATHVNKPYWAPIGLNDYDFWQYDYSPLGGAIPLTVVSFAGILKTVLMAAGSSLVGIWSGSWLSRLKR